MSRVRDLRYFSRYELWSRLQRKSSVRLCNNTYIEDAGETALAIRLHKTRILTFHQDGSFTINSGGWRTVTTKQRINALLPPHYRVYAKKRRWFISTPQGEFPFVDGDRWPPPQLVLEYD